MVERYYVNVEIRSGEYIEFGAHNTNIYKHTTNAFIKYIQEEATFKINSRLILNNLNFMSFIYLSTEYNDETVIKNTPTDKDLYKGNLQWLKIKYNDIYNELIDNKQVVVGYMLVYDNIRNTPGYRTIDIIESRIKRSGLASILLDEYMDKTKMILVPEIPLKGTEKFWLNSPVFKYCSTPEEIVELYKEAYEYSDAYKNIHKWDNLISCINDDNMKNIT